MIDMLIEIVVPIVGFLVLWALFTPASWTCAIFGHQPMEGVSSGAEYMTVTRTVIDGIRREHGYLRAKCHRCSALYEAGKIHLPAREKERELERQLAAMDGDVSMSDLQHYDDTSGQLPIATIDQVPLDWGDVAHLPAAAHHAAMRGNARRADDIELEHIRRTQFGVVLREDQHDHGGRPTHASDEPITLGTPMRIVRGLGKSGRMAVEWRTEGGTVYADIDGKEIKHDEENLYLPLR